mmetsp:Transcript_15065/g.47279  ORF Transcript_15065/g.47279 Transcript_15065/m.47279 type:complete len:177 (+) Transcript_15065:68-598(+)
MGVQAGSRGRGRSSRSSPSPADVGGRRLRSRSRSAVRARRRAERRARRLAATALQAPDGVFPLVRMLEEGTQADRLEAAGALGEIAGNGDETDHSEIIAAGCVDLLVRLLVDRGQKHAEGPRLAAEVLGHLAETHAGDVLAAGAAEPLAKLRAEGLLEGRRAAEVALRHLAVGSDA